MYFQVTQAHVSFFLEVSSNALAGQSSQPSVKLSCTAHLVCSQMLALVSYDLLSGDFMVHLPFVKSCSYSFKYRWLNGKLSSNLLHELRQFSVQS